MQRHAMRDGHQPDEPEDPRDGSPADTHPEAPPGAPGESAPGTSCACAPNAVSPSAELDTTHTRRGGIRQRLRRWRDLRSLEAFGITRSTVETLDGDSLHQLAAWIRLPSIWGAMSFAYIISAEIVAGAVAVGRHAGWWQETGWLPLTGAAFIAWVALAQPLMVGLATMENRLDTYLDPFFTFGRAGSQAIRTLTSTRGSQLRRRTVALASLRQWHAEGNRLGLDVEERFQRAATPLGSARPLAGITAEVWAQVVPLLIATIHGAFDSGTFPDRKRARASRPTLIKAVLAVLGAPAVVAVIQLFAELLS